MRIYSLNSYNTLEKELIWANKLVLDDMYFLEAVWGKVANKATPTGVIIWVNNSYLTYATDNETVLKQTVAYAPKEMQRLYEVDTSASITWDDVWSFFKVSTDSKTVDVASKSTTAGQLKLIKTLSDKKWVFELV